MQRFITKLPILNIRGADTRHLAHRRSFGLEGGQPKKLYEQTHAAFLFSFSYPDTVGELDLQPSEWLLPPLLAKAPASCAECRQLKIKNAKRQLQ